MTTQLDPEARFLELAACPGMEGLRYWKPGYQHRNDNWLPLPESERLGALVEFATREFGRTDFQQYKKGMVYCRVGDIWEASGPTHWAALTEALLGAPVKP